MQFIEAVVLTVFAPVFKCFDINWKDVSPDEPLGSEEKTSKGFEQ